MKKIIVSYWSGIKPNQEYEYSIEKRIEIVNSFLDKGLNIMLYQIDDRKTLVIWIDNKKFQQR
jgi:hypothetical protein